MVLDQGVRRKGKKGKVALPLASSQPNSPSGTATEQPLSAFAALDSILTAVGPWLDAETHKTTSTTLLSLSLSPSSSLKIFPKLLASLCSSPHQCTVPLVLPALHKGSLVLDGKKVDAKAVTSSLLSTLHPQCASLDLKTTPMICTSQLSDAIESLGEQEGDDETENELSSQLREAKEKISALEEKIKAQERLLKDAEKREESHRKGASTEQTKSPDSPNIGLKRSADENLMGCRGGVSAEEKTGYNQTVKKMRDSYEMVDHQEDIPVRTKHHEFNSLNANSASVPTNSSTATPVPPKITSDTTLTSKEFLDKQAPSSSSSTATALPSVSAGGDGTLGKQLTVEEMLADFKDKLSDNLLRMGNPSYVNAVLQDSDSD